MAQWFATGRVIDWIVALVILEGAALIAYHRVTGRGLAPTRVIGNLAAGMGLLLALRAALAGAQWSWIAASLTAALLAHLADLRGRMQSEDAAASAQHTHSSKHSNEQRGASWETER